MIKLIVIRHGQTEENIGHIMQGNMDTKLNEKGKTQASALIEKVREKHIDVVFSSPKSRAYDTAKIVTENSLPIITDDRLKSRNHGEFQGLDRRKMDNENYWNYKRNVKYKEAENIQDLYNRVASLLEEIKEKYDGKTVLIVTHSGICRILYYYFNGIPEDGDMMGYESHNCSLEEYVL